MTEREALDRVIEMRQQVIDGGVLYNIYAGDSPCDIVNSVSNFNELLDHVSAYAVRMPVKKKRVPLTKEDLDARFLAGKTMRFVKGKDLCEFTRWHYDCAGYFCVSGSENVGGGSVYSGFIHCKFIDGDPCYKEVEE